MKKQIFIFALSVLFTNFLSAQALGGGGGNCPHCSCMSIFTSCSSGQCCPPNLPSCTCTAFSASCGCIGPGTTGRIVLNEGNLNEFQTFISGSDFSSPASKQLKNEIGAWLTSYNNGALEQVVTKGTEVENLAKSLPAGEKQKANAWIQARGGTTLIE